MFGHQDDQPDHHDDQPLDNVLTNDVADAVAQGDQGAPALGDESVVSDDFNPALPIPSPTPSITGHGQPLTLPTPTTDDDTADQARDSTDSTAAEDTTATPPELPSSRDSTTNTSADPDLLDIKLQALNQLSPLVNHLDQTPEEKFRTTMMMIQAADNQDLIKTAYEAAQAISDEKVKAQALLDIVNEINYFTQKNS